jgi:hypothetical protein
MVTDNNKSKGESKMQEILVIDSLPGSGKTTYIIDLLKKENKQFVYVTPLLSETERIMNEIPNTFTPKGIKHLSFNSMLVNGYNIATTHSLFLQLNDTWVLDNTTLVIDEALDCIEVYPLSKGKIKDLLSRSISIGEDGKLIWIGDITEYSQKGDSEVYAIYSACLNDCAYLINNNVVIVELSPKLLSKFSKVYILTYNFASSLFASWLTKHCIIARYLRPKLLKTDSEIKEQMKDLVSFVDYSPIDKLNYSYSYTDWIERINTDKLMSKFTSYFTNNPHPTSKILYTCPKDKKSSVSGRGWKRAKWLSSRTKATNEYRQCNFIVYLYNKYYNPNIKLFSNKHGIPLDNDQYALTELIQFIFRSALRDGKPITLMLPSKRMRNLFKNWLNE